MKLFKTILKVLLVLVIIYVISALFAKSSYKVERTATINAPQKLVYIHLGILRNWENWSPWKEMDPSAVNTYEGPDGKAGSIMKWKGDKTGSGQIEIVTADPPYYMKYNLKFFGFLSMQSEGAFQLTALAPDKTRVVWTDVGEIPFAFRPMMMFSGMDKMMGPEFEKGLANVDALSTNQYREALKAMNKDSIQ